MIQNNDDNLILDKSNYISYKPTKLTIIYTVCCAVILLKFFIGMFNSGSFSFSLGLIIPSAALLILFATYKLSGTKRSLIILGLALLYIIDIVVSNYGISNIFTSLRYLLQIIVILSLLLFLPMLLILSKAETKKIKVITGTILFFILIGLWAPIWEVSTTINQITTLNGLQSLYIIIYFMNNDLVHMNFVLSLLIFDFVICFIPILFLRNSSLIYSFIKYTFLLIVALIPTIVIDMSMINFSWIIRIYFNYFTLYGVYFLFAFSLVETILTHKLLGIRTFEADHLRQIAEPVLFEDKESDEKMSEEIDE